MQNSKDEKHSLFNTFKLIRSTIFIICVLRCVAAIENFHVVLLAPNLVPVWITSFLFNCKDFRWWFKIRNITLILPRDCMLKPAWNQLNINQKFFFLLSVVVGWNKPLPILNSPSEFTALSRHLYFAEPGYENITNRFLLQNVFIGNKDVQIWMTNNYNNL